MGIKKRGANLMDEETSDYIKELHEKFDRKNKMIRKRSENFFLRFYKDFIHANSQDVDEYTSEWGDFYSKMRHDPKLTKDVLQNIVWDSLSLLRTILSYYYIELELNKDQKLHDWNIDRILKVIESRFSIPDKFKKSK